jgi:hypothetical protein
MQSKVPHLSNDLAKRKFWRGENVWDDAQYMQELGMEISFGSERCEKTNINARPQKRKDSFEGFRGIIIEKNPGKLQGKKFASERKSSSLFQFSPSITFQSSCTFPFPKPRLPSRQHTATEKYEIIFWSVNPSCHISNPLFSPKFTTMPSWKFLPQLNFQTACIRSSDLPALLAKAKARRIV